RFPQPCFPAVGGRPDTRSAATPPLFRPERRLASCAAGHRFARRGSRLIPYILFGLFALTLLGIATLHKHALQIALLGLAAVLIAKLTLTDFELAAHLQHEARDLLNLGGLLLGFAVLANHFERSHLPDKLTQVLPSRMLGAF